MELFVFGQADFSFRGIAGGSLPGLGDGSMKKRGTACLVVGVLLLMLAGFGVKHYSDHYVWFLGESISRETKQLDLSEKEVAVSDYERLCEVLPECEIIWMVPFQGENYPSTTRELKVTELSETDLEMLRYFPELTVLDAVGCTDYAQLLAFRDSRPQCSVEYSVELAGTVYDHDARVLRIENPNVEELEEKLPYLPEVFRVRMSGQLPDVEELLRLRQVFPGVDIRWKLPFEGKELSSSDRIIDLSGSGLNYSEARELIRWFPDAETFDMRGCALTDQEMMDLADACPQSFFLWEMTIGELVFPTDAVEIDISGQVMQRTEEIESLLPYFPYVEKVVMSHCGFDDETMDALNKRYEDIRFVWSVKIREVYLRTDALYFYPYKFYRTMTVNNKDLYPLRYCTDIICIDIGHMGDVKECEWAAYMPNLKYLVLAETGITDLTPLSGLKNLVFLEIFKTRITDYSPLVGCTGLEDLNMSMTYGDYRPIAQMTWLKNLWWNGVARTVGLPCSGAPQVLEEALPNTKLVFHQAYSAWYTGWRDLQNYFDMRDVLGMFYLR